MLNTCTVGSFTVWLFLNTLCNPRNVPAQKLPPFLSLDIPQNIHREYFFGGNKGKPTTGSTRRWATTQIQPSPIWRQLRSVAWLGPLTPLPLFHICRSILEEIVSTLTQQLTAADPIYMVEKLKENKFKSPEIEASKKPPNKWFNAFNAAALQITRAAEWTHHHSPVQTPVKVFLQLKWWRRRTTQRFG